MLKESALNQAATIGNNATARGLSLVAMPGTPLAALSITTACCETEDYKRDGIAAIAKASASSQLKMYDHASEEYEIAKNLRIFLEGKVIRTIQEELTPLIREIRGAVAKKRVDIAEENALGITIELHDAKDVYNSAFLEQAVMNTALKRQPSRGVTESLRNMLLADLTAEQAIDVMKSVSNETNVQVAEMMISSDDAFYGLLRATPRDSIMDVYSSNNDLLSFLFLRGVQNDQHPLVKNDNLSSEQRVDIAGAISAYQWAISEKLTALQRMSQDGRIWLSVTGKTIHVSGKRYLQWLEKENTSKEIVIGAVDRFGTRAIEILNDESTYEDMKKYFAHAMARTENVIRSSSEAQVEQITEQMLVRHFHEEARISEVAEQSLKEDVQAVREYFRVTRKDPLELDATFISRAVCRTVGRGLDAEMILTEMQHYLEAEDNQDATVAAALQFAVARLLGRYLAKQTIIEKFEGGSFAAQSVAVTKG